MIYFRFNKIFCIIFKYPINIEWFIYKKFSNGIFLYSRVKFMNKVTRNRYDFERIESFFTRKNISRYFPIIQNVNLHLAFTYFTKRLQWKKKKREKISIIIIILTSARNFLSFFLFYSRSKFLRRNIHHFVSPFRFFFFFSIFFSVSIFSSKCVIVSHRIYESNTRDFYVFTIFYSHPSW